ncbi:MULTISPECIES: GNAT family N-acetyltransferase [Enterococcus]|uniref:N-acetyltransferase domain-containing protein n=1 Tax=Enterococcus sulfureus ATCC 49903 TaxID=1140003 RepID=S0L7X6_9ENTE|nr:GNAT family N-acetyltransferase [Enterococcus sulfureus]EOT47616.1 hypothetical protein OMY_00990 [Enterococcus sulfureus ATCC 49903]EOT83963.1 hypothetical protein I573_01688 [Enterococcus sulfureus ATCC 49903]
MNLKQATSRELAAIETFYEKTIPLIDPDTTSWILGVYPSIDSVLSAINKKEFYLFVDDSMTILATVILNHQAHENYQKLTWLTQNTTAHDHLIVHTLIVDQTRKNQGIGTKLMKAIKTYAQDLGVVSIRLDTAKTNLPAQHLYEKQGFTYIGQVDLPKFDQTGVDECVCYEYLLS